NWPAWKALPEPSQTRASGWIMETPQVFQHALLVRAYETVMRERLLVTDEVSALQHLGSPPVHLVKNDSPNPKITFPEDLALAAKMLAL
ncbi:MAG TPA: 2-C-methyl-D-erythritol 4-phosphate cytidylyltransferase, partial [Prosthecobacter sp.]|nr:2-C-methyl-D-erythritol 4-phosphate cytidylyltransferase [Prosthecobacter sp.]